MSKKRMRETLCTWFWLFKYIYYQIFVLYAHLLIWQSFISFRWNKGWTDQRPETNHNFIPNISFYAFCSVSNILTIVETHCRRTDGPTDWQTDIVTYRAAIAAKNIWQLKTQMIFFGLEHFLEWDKIDWLIDWLFWAFLT